MATIQHFEDLIIWKQATYLALKSFRIFKDQSNRLYQDLIRQLLRSVVSVPSNIAEGFERTGRKEFAHFLSIAKGSNGEFLTQLFIAHELQLISDGNFSELNNLSLANGKLIKNLIKYLNSAQNNNSSYKTVEEYETEYQQNLNIDELNTIS